jgi:hypothetical protein
LIRRPLGRNRDAVEAAPQQRTGAFVAMSDIEHRNDSVNGNPNQDELLWGTADIGRAINRNPRQVFHLISTGALKSVQKKGGRYVASRAALLKELAG